MTDSLSRTLTEAAWAEMKDSPYSNWAYGVLPPKAKARVDRTVAAVLEKLAAEFDGVAPDECHPTDTLLRLAGEIREDG